MGFFSFIDSLDMAENHANEVTTLETEQAERLLSIYQKIAKKLRYRLRLDRSRSMPEVLEPQFQNVPNNTFTDQQMRGVLLQLEAAIQALSGELSTEMGFATQLLGDKGIGHLIDEMNFFNDAFEGAVTPVYFDAVKIALSEGNMLFNQYQVSIDSYTMGLRQTMADGLLEAVIAKVPTENVISRLGSFFDGEEWRLRRIVRTELHNIYGSAKLSGLGEIAKTEPQLRKTLYHPMDSRTAPDSQLLVMAAERGVKEVSDPKLGSITDAELIVPATQPFHYTYQSSKGRKVTRTYMAPPDRPNDRSIMIPYHPSWD